MRPAVRQLERAARAPGRRRPGAWALTGDCRVNSRLARANQSSSIMDSTSAVVPTFRKLATSDMLASPTMTCSRRYFWASQCGSSRVLTIGRFSVVSSPTSSSKKSARWVSWKLTS